MVSVFANSQHSVDLLRTVELYEQRSTPCHENEAKEESAERKAGCNLHCVIQSSFDFGVRRRVLSWGWGNSWDIVVLRGDRRMILLVTLNSYRKNTSSKLSVDRHLFSLFIYGYFQLATINDDNVLERAVATVLWNILDLMDNFHALEDLTEDNMFSIQPRGDNSSNEKLRTVGILSSIGHRQETRTSVFEFKVLIGEAITIDGFSASTVTTGEVAALDHEVLDDTVELGTLVAKTGITDRQSSEVLCGLGDTAAEQPKGNPSQRLTTVFNVEVNLGSDPRSFCSLYPLDRESGERHEE